MEGFSQQNSSCAPIKIPNIKMYFHVDDPFFSLNKFLNTITWPTPIKTITNASPMDHNITLKLRSSALFLPCASLRR